MENERTNRNGPALIARRPSMLPTDRSNIQLLVEKRR
jgi:hypothetical protein